MARPRRLPGSSEVRVGCPPLGRAERTFWVRLRPYGWISSFFTAVFCSTQLASFTAVPVVPLDPQEELMVTRDHRSVPFWDPISQPALAYIFSARVTGGLHHELTTDATRK